jgi:hypothetical protein
VGAWTAASGVAPKNTCSLDWNNSRTTSKRGLQLDSAAYCHVVKVCHFANAERTAAIWLPPTTVHLARPNAGPRRRARREGELFSSSIQLHTFSSEVLEPQLLELLKRLKLRRVRHLPRQAGFTQHWSPDELVLVLVEEERTRTSTLGDSNAAINPARRYQAINRCSRQP